MDSAKTLYEKNVHRTNTMPASNPVQNSIFFSQKKCWVKFWLFYCWAIGFLPGRYGQVPFVEAHRVALFSKKNLKPRKYLVATGSLRSLELRSRCDTKAGARVADREQ